MQIRVTSVATPESAPRLRPVLVALENRLNTAGLTGTFGKAPDMLAFIVVSVDDEQGLNERWMRSHDKSGWDKDPVTGERKTYVSLAVHVAPSTIDTADTGVVVATVIAAIRRRLALPPTKCPKGFDYDGCFAALSSLLDRYGPA